MIVTLFETNSFFRFTVQSYNYSNISAVVINKM